MFQGLQKEERSIDSLISQILQLQQAQPVGHQLTLIGPEATSARAAQQSDSPKPGDAATQSPASQRRGGANTVLGPSPNAGNPGREEAMMKRAPPDSTAAEAPQAEAHTGTDPSKDNMSDIYFILTVVGVCTSVVCMTILGGLCYRYMQRGRSRASSEGDGPSYGVTGPHHDVSPSGDRKLAQSAQLYHYQHQKQQMMAIEEGRAMGSRQGSPSDEDSDDEQEHTVYECPGLAPSGEMEVKNPLFSEDQTSSQSGPDTSDP
ncbi:neural proliferation differentiation and control protein 1-like [Pollicipes pollicipes]|uniref:neural proliferation differentiation and control protein 1-like n=1 Tax=Pollicipes pollicipes TaxID=41117 RepID=UPI0018851FB5|nr:neural proliferation differentiation and control protein 1-like [Pollicipes pollicipes]